MVRLASPKTSPKSLVPTVAEMGHRQSFSKSRKKFSNQEQAKTIKNTQTRSKHARARSKFLFQKIVKRFSKTRKDILSGQLKQMTDQDFVTQFVERSPKKKI